MIELTAGEREFLERVQAYCAEGLTGKAMAQREGLSWPGFRARLSRLGFSIVEHARRELVRSRSTETLASLDEAGQIITR